MRLLSELALAQLRTGDKEAALATAREAHALLRGSLVAGEALAQVMATGGASASTVAALRARSARQDGG